MEHINKRQTMILTKGILLFMCAALIVASEASTFSITGTQGPIIGTQGERIEGVRITIKEDVSGLPFQQSADIQVSRRVIDLDTLEEISGPDTEGLRPIQARHIGPPNSGKDAEMQKPIEDWHGYSFNVKRGKGSGINNCRHLGVILYF